ncbi:TIMELESS-interacting protein [Hetaerina americana]|uniref:TIMELESS-interacting protein n=1 Tax=Hetaerina americana TaxID=62018 RepID=UPI003A7F3871
MFDGDGYEDQLLGDPNQLDDLIQARDLNPIEDEPNEEEGNGDDEQDEEKGDDSSKNKTRRKVVLHPQPKLDDVRLTGPRGLTAIEGYFQDFKFLGHGHEEQDLKRVMERIELWGNRLFPKYQFDDLLEKVEKVGQKRSVMNFVTKIRMGLVNEDMVGEGPKEEINDEMCLDDDPPEDNERNANASNDLFDQLIEQQLSQVESQQKHSSAPTTQTTITEEQRQRMMENRRLAEERRLARLKAQEEKSVSSIVEESSQTVALSEQSITSKPMETSDEGHLVIPSDDTRQNSVNECADGNEDKGDAVVLTNKEQNSEEMETSPSNVEEGD